MNIKTECVRKQNLYSSISIHPNHFQLKHSTLLGLLKARRTSRVLNSRAGWKKYNFTSKQTKWRVIYCKWCFRIIQFEPIFYHYILTTTILQAWTIYFWPKILWSYFKLAATRLHLPFQAHSQNKRTFFVYASMILAYFVLFGSFGLSMALRAQKYYHFWQGTIDSCLHVMRVLSV